MVRQIDIDIYFLEIWWVTHAPFFLIKINQPVFVFKNSLGSYLVLVFGFYKSENLDNMQMLLF